MMANPVVEDVAAFLRDLKSGLSVDDSEAAAMDLLQLTHGSLLKATGVDKDDYAFFPSCGSGVIRVTITKGGQLSPENTDLDRWILILSDAEERGHVARVVNLNKRISQYLRSTLAMIEDELPE